VEASIDVVRVAAQCEGDFACIGIDIEGLVLSKRNWSESQREREY
jgi:hypothetical protein